MPSYIGQRFYRNFYMSPNAEYFPQPLEIEMDFYLATGIIMFLTLVVPMFLPLLLKSWSLIVAILVLDVLAIVQIIRHIDPTTMKF